jgi:uncharacterized repeat protein (TIGR01451 family)
MMDADRVLHRIGISIGAIMLGIGVVLLFATDTADTIPIGLWVADVGALVAILLGVWVARTRYRTRPDETTVPDVERRLATPSPGHELDTLIYRLTELREGTIEYRERIQRRVGDIAVRVITRRQDCSRDEARTQLAEGTWSDNSMATSFFTGGSRARTRSLLGEVLAHISGTENPYKRQVQETITAIEAVGNFEFAANASTDGRLSRGRDSTAIVGDEEGEWMTDHVRYVSLRQTAHWTGITAFALVALAVGILAAEPALLLASTVAIGIAGYTRVSSAPGLTDLEVTRTVDDEAPEPGDEIEVRVTVENTGDAFLPDLRLVERIPPMMQVVDGSARLGTALQPGGTATFSYTAIAERGEHTWPLQVIGRDASGAREREALIETETTVECSPRLKTTTEMPVRMQTSVYAGDVETDIGGEGLEFHSTRDYQPGDPKRRIDWKTYARTGNLSTVEFRKEQAARVVLLFDGRDASYVSTAPGRKHALDRAIDGAMDIYASLHDQGHLIGLAAFNGIPCWLAPGTGTRHRERIRQLLIEHPALSPLPPDVIETAEGQYIDPMTHIRRQLPANTQIILFSPLTDEYPHQIARRFDGAGHLVTVISPDPTTGRTLGQRIVRLERAVLIEQLRDHGIRVVDWSENDPLPLELGHANRRWNR